jgi:hypothetical protein
MKIVGLEFNYRDSHEHHRIPDENGTVLLYAKRSDMTDYHKLPKRNTWLTTRMDGKEPFKWRGSIIVMRKVWQTTGPEIKEFFLDADLSDLETVINDFKCRNSSKRNIYEDDNSECKYHKNRLHASGSGLVRGVMIS